MSDETEKDPALSVPEGYIYKWENNAVYVSNDDGVTWKLFMYFPPK